ncbi:unnamed protein product [Bursaphelenchus okinawaensis]|uniref:Palmitoyltransferase n=1 Tax=Bursaphelenchus okinawaensis TaxID=465554 RepID=A0A811KK87_9BILA|nr:unnamed protein product [Bursaphelenchus okinawaensis]CAG9104980.1 unnamed protein product [Bursaphelenchus okinawaensis]
MTEWETEGHEPHNMANIMQARGAAQLGEYNAIKGLLDAGLVQAGATDPDDCSLLHWAAINNRLDVARLLIERGAPVNAIGGVLSSTPLHWASRHGHHSIVALLIQNGADPEIKDGEGFMPIHIATQFASAPVVAYLIASGQSPNALDSTKMTPLMWAAFKVQGPNPLNMLIQLGADVNMVDSNFHDTALHWAVISGNTIAVRELLKTGIDIDAVNRQNETALDIAKQQNRNVIINMLEVARRKRKQTPISFKQKLYEDEVIKKRIIMLIPAVIFTTMLLTFYANTDLRLKIFLFVIYFICGIFVKTTYLKYNRRECIDYLPMSMAFSTIMLYIFTWFTFLNVTMPWHTQIFVLFIVFLVPYLFLKSVFSDPGIVKSTDAEKMKATKEAIEENLLGQHFCVTCLMKKLPRSKHCRMCEHCILRFDHHCPWIGNCVGGKNHRLFVAMLFVTFIGSAIVTLSCIFYMRSECSELEFHQVIGCEPAVLMTATIGVLSTGVVFSLLAIQIYQIASGFTTNERLNAQRYGYMTVKEDNIVNKSPYDNGFTENFRIFLMAKHLDFVDSGPSQEGYINV